MRGATQTHSSRFALESFQSTLLMRGATSHTSSRPDASAGHFNPRSSCEERPFVKWSSHQPSSYFNPRSSCEERPDFKALDFRHGLISIHAPHARSDSRWAEKAWASSYFNPRSSCEERHDDDWKGLARVDFNSRSSCEERLAALITTYTIEMEFQSTLLMRGATLPAKDYQGRPIQFQSTLLMRGAT